MGKYFNTEGRCVPELHYMVSLNERVDEIKRLYVDEGRYFIINKGRQYGKTTTLRILAEYLKRDYIVLFVDFQTIGEEEFADAGVFSLAFAEIFIKVFCNACKERGQELVKPLLAFVNEEAHLTLRRLFERISAICAKAPKPVVLLIDEVDSASDNQVFIDFLAQLRAYYLDRENSPICQSVILAGVYDIKNLKLKIRSDQEHKFNSPWNIAAKFIVEMSFLPGQIASMLREYEQDRHTGMDVEAVSEIIYQYTSGYPYLVSAICKVLDEELPRKNNFTNTGCIWSRQGISEAVKIILSENVSLFDSMTKQLDTYRDLQDMIESILYQGRQIVYSPAENSIHLGTMFGFLKNAGGYVGVANRIFEMYLLNLFAAKESVGSEMFLCGQEGKNQFTRGAKLNMDLVLEKFVMYFTDIYGGNEDKFIEKFGRKLFLLYLKPIINGTGNYYIEAETRDARRTDVIIDYAGEQFIVELKIWHGNEYNERGEEQLAEYLEYYRQKKGYMVSFNFNKSKSVGIKEVRLGDKIIVEAVV